MLEVDRIGANRPLGEIVDALEKIEKRKAEMRLGLTNRSTQQEIISKTITPVQVPPVSAQEPVITRPVTAQEITHEQMNQLLKTQADNLTNTFQAQIQALQDKISQQSRPAPMPKRQKPPVPPKNWKQILDTYESANPFDDEVTGDPLAIIVERAVNKRRQKFMRQEIDKLADRFAGMGVHDDYDPMDTSNLADGSVVFTDGNGNEYVCYTTRSVKKK